MTFVFWLTAILAVCLGLSVARMAMTFIWPSDDPDAKSYSRENFIGLTVAFVICVGIAFFANEAAKPSAYELCMKGVKSGYIADELERKAVVDHTVNCYMESATPTAN
ncbi:hypothetical protein SAMN05518849_11674 [Sphingobium sp. AP50]|uniref:hypothetical protein n=1 Tax=Sphingobium sp. AP50 TaxID=1884369 RepID=UPI0008C127C9|nr:hypothetical protein [Sphingobium sp. AP50]SEJ87372.1 hypothetical protein SAMN05518849_11674 [Sphingobium sp. AP50]